MQYAAITVQLIVHREGHRQSRNLARALKHPALKLPVLAAIARQLPGRHDGPFRAITCPLHVLQLLLVRVEKLGDFGRILVGALGTDQTLDEVLVLPNLLVLQLL